MPPDFDWSRLLVDLPLAAAIGIGARWVIGKLSRREWITRETFDEERADDRERLAYIEARRVEEREGRIKAEERIVALTVRWDRALELLASIERETIRLAERQVSRLRDAGD